MTERDRDYELSLHALRSAAHPEVDKARVRERLVARGVLGAAAASSVAGVASAQTLGGGMALGLKFLAGAALATGLTVFALTHGGTSAAPAAPSLDRVITFDERGPTIKPPRYVWAARERAPAREAVTRRRPRAPRAEPSMLDLARENVLLSAAMTALRSGDRSRARDFLDQHAREFPDGFLRAEREKARDRLGPGTP